MNISACYIVKNEAVNLSKSLKSLQGMVDEIIVIDTGSTDDTINVARKYSAKVYNMPWQNDFSLARNMALDKAGGDWIIFLDADEFFTAETAVNIRDVIEKNKHTDVLYLYMVNVDQDSGKIIMSFVIPRIFKNISELRYYGSIHEELLYKGNEIENMQIISPNLLKIIHTGYSQSKSLKKAERNLELLKKEQEKTDTPEKLYAYMAECYLGLGLNVQAKYYAYLDIKNGRRMVNFASKSWHILLKILAQEGNMKERKKIAVSAVDNFPEIPDFRAELAECLAYEKNYIDAVENAKKAEELFIKYEGLEPIRFTDETLTILKKRSNLWNLNVRYGEKYTEYLMAFFNDLTGAMKENIAQICAVIIKLYAEKDEEKEEMIYNLGTLLPDRVQHVVEAWKENKLIDENYYDAYIVILSYITKYGNREQIENYLKLGMRFDPTELMKIAEYLFAEKRWKEAWKVYSCIPSDSAEVTQTFWLHAGICQYEEGNFAIAAECFERGKEYSGDNAELQAYIRWNERQMN